MSRTYRRAKANAKHLVTGRYGILREYGGREWRDYYLDVNSKEAKKKINALQSDRGHGWLSYKGPSWFVREFVQVPYRANARQQLIRFMKDPTFEVQLDGKPVKDVYWL